MPRDSTGAYSLPLQPFVAGTKAKASDMNTTLADLATEMAASYTRAEAAGKAAIGDVAWRVVSTQAASAGQVNVIFTLPATFSRFRLEFSGVAPVTSGFPLIARMSVDGTTFYSGASDYPACSRNLVNGAAADVSGAFDFIGLTAPLVAGTTCAGEIEFRNGADHTFMVRSTGRMSGLVPFLVNSGGLIAQGWNTPMAAILLGITSGHSSGTYRLLGAP